METAERLWADLQATLTDLRGLERRRLPGPDQMLTNALGITLAHRWGRRDSHNLERLHTYAPQHLNGRSGISHFTAVPAKEKRELRTNRHVYSFLLDFFVEERKANGKEVPVVGAEIEAYPRHGVSDDIDTNDYQWDFYKLLHVRVPRRLFVACAARGGHQVLMKSLKNAWWRTSDVVAQEKDQLAVILLPAGSTETKDVWLGIAAGRSALQFSPAPDLAAL